MNDSQRLSATVPLDFAGKRLDQALATLFNDYSRARLQQWVRDGLVTVDGNCWQVNKDKLCGGEVIEVVAELPQETRWQPQAIKLDVIYEDAHILIINKPPGLVVHPAAGNRDGTLLNALLHYAPELQHVPRAGIVHRLDKDTSGLMVVARSLTAQKHLVEQLQARRMAREYDAVVFGALVAGGSVDAPIGRHPVDRKRMAVVEQESKGKPAVSHYRVQERFKDFTHVSVRLETGRTHQIRVHMTHIRHSLVGDPVYGGRLRIPKGASERLAQALREFKRQALHARLLRLTHPESGELQEWQVAIPHDIEQLLAMLREENPR